MRYRQIGIQIFKQPVRHFHAEGISALETLLLLEGAESLFQPSQCFLRQLVCLLKTRHNAALMEDASVISGRSVAMQPGRHNPELLP